MVITYIYNIAYKCTGMLYITCIVSEQDGHLIIV